MKDEEEVVVDPPEKADLRDPRGTLSEDDPNFVLHTENGGRLYIRRHGGVRIGRLIGRLKGLLKGHSNRGSAYSSTLM